MILRIGEEDAKVSIHGEGGGSFLLCIIAFGGSFLLIFASWLLELYFVSLVGCLLLVAGTYFFLSSKHIEAKALRKDIVRGLTCSECGSLLRFTDFSASTEKMHFSGNGMFCPQCRRLDESEGRINLVTASYRPSEEEIEAQKQYVAAYNKVCEEIASEIAGGSYACPHCKQVTKQIRHIHESDERVGYFICQLCDRSFTPPKGNRVMSYIS